MGGAVNQWTLVETFDHKIYRNQEGRVAFADWSGQYPEDTDDGILWLDTSGIVTPDGIPVVDDEGRKSWTPCNDNEKVFVIAEFGLRFEEANGTIMHGAGLTKDTVEKFWWGDQWYERFF